MVFRVSTVNCWLRNGIFQLNQIIYNAKPQLSEMLVLTAEYYTHIKCNCVRRYRKPL